MSYAPARFSCPHCRTPLRLRERPIASVRLVCPDCRRPLELTDQSGELLVRPAVPDGKPAEKNGVRRAAPFTSKRLEAIKTAARKLANPLVVTWVAAGLVAATLGIIVISERGSSGFAAAESIPASRAPQEATASAEKQITAEDPPQVESANLSTSGAADVETTLPATAASAGAERPPIEALKPVAAPAADPREAIAARLAQRVLRFEQSRPAAFELLRSEIEDLAGVPIRYDVSLGSDPPERSVPVMLSLSDASIAEVLEAAALQAGLTCVIEADGVRLIRDAASEHAAGTVSGGFYAVR